MFKRIVKHIIVIALLYLVTINTIILLELKNDTVLNYAWISPVLYILGKIINKFLKHKHGDSNGSTKN